MKLKVQDLKRIIREEAENAENEKYLHGYESDHPIDDEGEMIKTRMSGLKRMADEIEGALGNEDQLPAWVQDLVAQSYSTLEHVHAYLVDSNPEETNEAKRKGPSKKTAQKILKGTKTFKDKMKKVEKWADNPAAAAAWMKKRAGYKD